MIDHMILVDHSVAKLQSNLHPGQEEEFECYRMNTMPLLGHYEKKNRLYAVSCKNISFHHNL